jgi:hypothetical protein
MGTEQGRETRLYISDGSQVPNWLPIAGETTNSPKRTSTELDTSSKDDGIYGSTDYGQQKITVSVSGNVKLPDPGLERVDDVSKLSPPVEMVRIMRGAVVRFEGLMAIGNFSCDFPNAGTATYSFDLANKGAPTVDNMTATA